MPTLSITKTYDDNQVLNESDLDNIKTSIETFFNSTKIDSNNIQTAGIATANYATGSVDTAALGSLAVTLAKLAAETSAFLVPTGTVHAYSAASAPTGYLLCDGSAVNRTTYAALFAIIGETFGEGNNTTTFNVPDFRGRFLRGYDAGAGRDPDAASRTTMNTGGNSGDNIGTLQVYKTKAPTTAFTFSGTTSGQSVSHTHAAGDGGNFVTNTGASTFTSGAGTPLNTTANTGAASADHTHTYSGNVAGGDSETRPLNASINYIIKT